MITAEALKNHLDFRQFYIAELGTLQPGNNGNAQALCPFHDDREPSLSVNLKNGLWQCFGCRASGDVIAFYMKRHNCDFPTALRELARFAGLDPDETRPGGKADGGLTLLEFAASKKLPEDFLRTMGVKEARGKDGRPYLVFEYRGLYGQVIPEATRMRFSLSKKPRAKRNGKPAVYGLWLIPKFLTEDGELLIFEGESDSLTAWHYGLPALGIPGKTMTRLLDPAFLQGFKTVYVWQEPGAEDFPISLAKALPGFTIKRMLPPEGVKDISEAHCRGLDVLGLMRQMQREAKEVTTEDYNGNASDREGSANSRASTQAFLINVCQNHANEGGDRETCQHVIDFIKRLGQERNIAKEVREWCLLQSGYFLVTDCYKDLDLVTSSYKSRGTGDLASAGPGGGNRTPRQRPGLLSPGGQGR